MEPDDLSKLGIIDMHVHVGPEFLKRRYNVLRLALELASFNIGAVIKNHFVLTTGLAAMVRSLGYTNIWGSITLNQGVGGLNPEALRAAISSNKTNSSAEDPDNIRFVVWMPTIHALAHLEKIGYDIDPLWGASVKYCKKKHEVTPITVLDKNGSLKKEAIEILEIIRDEDLILATGHLGVDETFKLVEEAITRGVKRIVVTHPSYPPTNMSVHDQKNLARKNGVYIEQAYADFLIYRIDLRNCLDSIREVGYEKTILTSDLGQFNQTSVINGLCRFINALIEMGLTTNEIKKMTSENPTRLLLK